MAKLVWKNGKWFDKATGEEAEYVQRWDFTRPWKGSIGADYEGYDCPVSGKWIEGRAAHEENLKVTGCRVLERGEKEENEKKASVATGREDARRDAAIDGIVDSVAAEYFS